MFINISYYTFESAWKLNGALPDFWNWLNSNISESSEYPVTLQKSLTFTYFFMRFKFVFYSKGMKAIQSIKVTVMFRRYSC